MSDSNTRIIKISSTPMGSLNAASASDSDDYVPHEDMQSKPVVRRQRRQTRSRKTSVMYEGLR